jgi:hypothetical protein
MALPWVRLDTAFPTNPKLLAMLQRKDGHRAALAYICGLAYSGAHGCDGFVTAEALPFIHARRAEASLLVTFGFWRTVTGGWEINGWNEFQESTEETQQRRRRAQAAAQARWNGHEAMTGAERTRQWRQRQNPDVTLPRDDARDKSTDGRTY